MKEDEGAERALFHCAGCGQLWTNDVARVCVCSWCNTPCLTAVDCAAQDGCPACLASLSPEQRRDMFVLVRGGKVG